ncbi:dihydrodipicolinate synthase family protein [Paenibacillus tepidiphilus]|uniref:dihydrodipicolinate synthase family protein n=1 Tax=Paenibacillus tepidiphilus TaxID=2608683 RepID=UPI001239BC4C|nr:dihydrodipicolinate synthase family protein [Paenibacillus tepidiphilus]
MFKGLSAFPLTPMDEVSGIHEASFIRLIERLAAARVDSIGALGSTGSYAYLTREERKRVTQLAVEHAADIPVIVSIGALRTRDVLHLAEDAQQAGASAVLLAPLSYQPLTEAEVFTLYETVTRTLSIPLCVYDNPATTHFRFSDELLGRIAQLPNVQSVKIPPLPPSQAEAKSRVDLLRVLLPEHVTLGISGDAAAALGLASGCQAWYSALAGLFPEVCLDITRAAQNGNHNEALRLSQALAPLWSLFTQHGSLRVVAAAAEWKGLIPGSALPLPIQPLSGAAAKQLYAYLDEAQFAKQ